MAVTAISDFREYYGKISNSGHDERNRYHSGKAGDQTGTEWCIRSWYKRPWNVVIRFTDSKIANMLATLSIYAARNNKIGYDQYQRTTYWTQLKKRGYDPRKISTACEEDCSAGVLANVKAALYLTGHKTWGDRININGYTGNMRGIICGCGASVKTFTDASHVNSTQYLLPGDILLNTSAHTAVNLGIGSKMREKVSTSSTFSKADSNKVKVVKALQASLNSSYGLSLAVDGSFGPKTQAAVDEHYLYYNPVRVLLRNAHVSWLQTELNKHGAKLTVDGLFGKNTQKAVKNFQKKYGLEVDGYAGVKTHWKLISLI